MIELCPFCGGLLKANGAGYRCPSCSSVFDSKAELERHRPKKSVATCTGSRMEMRANASSGGGASMQSTSQAGVPTGKATADSGAMVFDSNIKGVLEIYWTDGPYKHSGSGFLVSADGYAITNAHVVTHESGASCGTVNVKICNQITTAQVVRLGDEAHGLGKGIDLALIKLASVPKNATVLKFGKLDDVRNGERVFVIGNSLGYGTCITSGIVSDRLRRVNGKMLMMTDCAINGGNSGGPIFNEKGQVIGAVVSGISSAEGMNFAIPSDDIKKFMKA